MKKEKQFSRVASLQEEQAFKLLEQEMPKEGLFDQKNWHQSPEPFFISSELEEKLEKLGPLLDHFTRACDLLYRQSLQGKQPAWIASLLDQGKPPELLELSRDRAFRTQRARVIRPDLLLTQKGWIICELDTIPGGLGLTAWLQQVYTKLGYQVAGGALGMIHGFRSLFESKKGGDILISEEAATYRPEMDYLIKALHHYFPEEKWRLLSSDDQGPWAREVYRFFELFDLSNIECASNLFEKARKGELLLTPPPKPQLEEKLWFALFWMKPLEEFWKRELTERGWRELQEMVPYSWILDPAPLPPQAVYPKLEAHSWSEVSEFSQQQRHLVIKISGFDERSWGSRGVTIGHDLSKEEWKRALSQALEQYPRHPHLLAQFHHSCLISHPYFSSPTEITHMPGRVRLTPYYFLSSQRVTLAGGLATICPSDKKVLHGMSDAILVPLGVNLGVKRYSCEVRCGP